MSKYSHQRYRFLKWLSNKVDQWLLDDQEMLVFRLTIQVASLQIPRDKCVYFAPLGGTWGPIMLSGNSLPTFTYRVFDKKLMEFVQVNVEISKPNRIDFYCITCANNNEDQNGKIVLCDEKYKQPFYQLAAGLLRYFPYTHLNNTYEEKLNIYSFNNNQLIAK